MHAKSGPGSWRPVPYRTGVAIWPIVAFGPLRAAAGAAGHPFGAVSWRGPIAAIGALATPRTFSAARAAAAVGATIRPVSMSMGWPLLAAGTLASFGVLHALFVAPAGRFGIAV